MSNATTNDVMDFLSGGGGGASAKFETVGDTIKGTIVAAEQRQQTAYKTEEPKFWDDGSPMMQLVITLQTEDRDPSEPDDDGKRNLYVKGSKKPESMSMTAALIAALKAAGGASIEVGGSLACRYTGERPSNKGNPAKTYQMSYKAPALNTGDLLDDDPAPAAAAPLDDLDF